MTHSISYGTKPGIDADVVLPGTGAMVVPHGPNRLRPMNAGIGMLRINTEHPQPELEVYDHIGLVWTKVGQTDAVNRIGDTMSGPLRMVETGSILGISGSVTNPGYGFANAEQTGFYLIDGRIGITINGTSVLEIGEHIHAKAPILVESNRIAIGTSRGGFRWDESEISIIMDGIQGIRFQSQSMSAGPDYQIGPVGTFRGCDFIATNQFVFEDNKAGLIRLNRHRIGLAYDGLERLVIDQDTVSLVNSQGLVLPITERPHPISGMIRLDPAGHLEWFHEKWHSIRPDALLHSSGGLIRGDLTFQNEVVVRNSNGTIKNPSYTFDYDPDTGMFALAPDQIGFTTNGSLRMKITDHIESSVGIIAPRYGFRDQPHSYIEHDTGISVVVDGKPRWKITETGLIPNQSNIGEYNNPVGIAHIDSLKVNDIAISSSARMSAIEDRFRIDFDTRFGLDLSDSDVCFPADFSIRLESGSRWDDSIGIGIRAHLGSVYLAVPAESSDIVVFRSGQSNVSSITREGEFTGTSASTRFADLAERYEADGDYPPGTVMVLGGSYEITITDKPADTRVVGVVSYRPGVKMNIDLQGRYTPFIALRGRVPVLVIGDVEVGDLLVTSELPGYSRAARHWEKVLRPHAVFAKAITSTRQWGTVRDTGFEIEAVIL